MHASETKNQGAQNQNATDAGETREALTRELADWLAAGFWPPRRARRFHRAVARLARTVGMTYDEVYAELLDDATELLATE